MSFFLWSSIPDDELRRAAAAGELSNPAMLAKQVKRMTADPKARRLATEFFGQWLGFYHFDQYRGVDTGRFPEFTDEVKSAMYDEAISTFEYIVRQDRPVREILHADYTFLNKPLAKFYGIDANVTSSDKVERVEGAQRVRPRRRAAARVRADDDLGAAAHQPRQARRLDPAAHPRNADAAAAGRRRQHPGRRSSTFSGLTLREKLAQHKRNATCANCHLRIDPLGFPLEGFDAVGRVAADLCRRQAGRRHGRVRGQDDDRRSRWPADVPAEPGQQGDDDAVEEDAGLRARTQPAWRPIARLIGEMTKAGERRVVLRTWRITDRDQPPVPQPRAATTRRTRAERRRARGQEANEHRPVSSSRRRRGVTSCEAWASRWRCPGWSRCRSSGRPRPRVEGQHAARCGWASSSSRTASSRSTGGPRAAARRWSSGRACCRCCRIARTWSSSRASTTSRRTSRPARTSGRMNLLSGAPVSLDPNEIRVGTSMDQVHRVRHRRPHGDSEPRARHRAQRAAARRRPVDDLRLERVVDLADQAGRPRRSIRHGRSIAWSATAPAARSTAASSTRCGRTHRASGRGSAGATTTS